MKISFDIDETYTAKPALFDYLQKRFKDSGNQVGILTCREPKQRLILPWVPDFEYYLDVKTDGSPEGNRRQALAKSEVIKAYGIDLHFDDIQEHFDPRLPVIHIVNF